MKLDELEKSELIVDNNAISFGLDVVALYDSLSHDLVYRALDDAIEDCRPDWDDDFRRWFREMIVLSFDQVVQVVHC